MTDEKVPPLTEKEWQKQVVELAGALGYRCYHTYFSIRSERGWPDLALFRPGRFLLAELKTDKGKLTAAQEGMIADLQAAGVEVHVWRPRDWDTMARVLQYGPCRCNGTGRVVIDRRVTPDGLVQSEQYAPCPACGGAK